MMNKKCVFVILHYNTIDVTIECVKSIREHIKYDNYDIVIVDNASPNASGQVLYQKYLGIENIHVLINRENKGFARGNNDGYIYAKDKLNAEFIIIINNDVIIEQRDFIEVTLKIYKNYRFHILGPDILNLKNEHQNPHRMDTFQKRDLNRIIINRTIILTYLKIKSLLKLQEKIQIIEKWDAKRTINEKKNISWDVIHEDVVLQGSCFIFSPDYIINEDEAFCPQTFLWMEEEILTYVCRKKRYKILYHPDLRILHMEAVSTSNNKTQTEKYYFYSQQLRKSAIVMKRIMKVRN